MRNEPADPRDHGFPSESEVDAIPKIRVRTKKMCPNCGCRSTFGIMVDLIRVEEKCRGHYRGCAACSWASAMVVILRTEEFLKDDYERLH